MEEAIAAERKKKSDCQAALGACAMLVAALSFGAGISIWGLSASGWDMPVDSK